MIAAAVEGADRMRLGREQALGLHATAAAWLVTRYDPVAIGEPS